MKNCTPDEVLGKIMANVQALGRPVNNELVAGMEPKAQASFSAKSGDWLDKLSTEFNAKHNTPSFKDNKKLGPLGFVKTVITMNTAPSTVLGEEFCAPLFEALREHKVEQGDYAAFKDNVLPVVEELQGQIQDHFEHAGQINFANQWLNFWEHGGVFHPPSENKFTQAALYLPRTAAGNIVQFNPFISIAHVLQTMPKAIGMYGLPATIKGMTELTANLAKYGGADKIPEIIHAGMLHEVHGNPILNIPGHVENTIGALSYYIGKSAGEDPRLAVSNMVYRPRLGDETISTWNPQNGQMLYLMRYAVGSTKMYGGWLKNIVHGTLSGDLKAAGKGATALAMFSVAQGILTGGKSTIPAPVYALLPDETKQALEEMDANTPFLDVVNKGTAGFLNLGEHFQPLGGLAYNIGSDIVNTGFKSAGSNAMNAKEDWTEGDFVRAGSDLAKSGLAVSSIAVPGVNTTIKKVFDLTSDAVLGDTQSEDIPMEAAQKFHFAPR